MNLLTFHVGELSDDRMLVVRGPRARHMIEVQEVRPGRVLRVAELGGRTGSAAVREIGEETVVLEVGELEACKQAPRIELVLALPRPQMLKRVLQLSSAMGLTAVRLIRSEHVERSYFSSSLLDPSRIEEELRTGLEQAGGARVPEVTVHDRFRRFVEDELVIAAGTRALIAHPSAPRSLAEVALEQPLEPGAPVVLAVGPEAGWNEFELSAFAAAGFVPFRSGERVLKVEHAVCMLLGQVQLLRALTAAGSNEERLG